MKRTYKCPHCRKEQSHNVWDFVVETKEISCVECQTVMIGKDVIEEGRMELSPILGEKMTKEQIKADRTTRSKTHFKKEVLPTLSGKDQRYFNSKHRNNKD